MTRRVLAKILFGLAAASSLAAPGLAQAGNVEVAGQSNAERCELHIWAAQDFSSLPFGSGLAPGLSMMFPGNLGQSTDEQFVTIASIDLQIEAIMRADPVTSLGLPQGTTVITNAETEEAKITKQRKARRAASQAPCYYELHITSSYLIEDIVWGDRFSTAFDVRQYRGDAEWTFRHRGEGGNKLTVFPVKEDDDPAEVLREVSEAIQANFGEYARKVKPRIERDGQRR